MLMQRLSIFNKHGVLALGQDFASMWKPFVAAAMVRIKSADCSPFVPLKHESDYCDVVEIEFDDIEDIGKETVEEIFEKGFTVFTVKHATTIVDFFEKNRDMPLVTHCAAGLSRSPAVGIAFSYFKRDLEGYNELLIEYCGANKLVLNVLKDEIDRRAVNEGLDPFEADMQTAWLICSA